MSSADQRVVGYCDGVRGDQIYGWAWYPEQPDRAVEIELLLDGTKILSVAATDYRADLRAAGIGNGRYGWHIPLPVRSGAGGPMSFITRAKDGAPLSDGVFEYDPEPSLEDAGNAEFQAFVRAVVDPASFEPPVAPVSVGPITNFLLYSAARPDTRSLGAAEYSYGFVMKAFLPLFEQLGRVHLIDDMTDGIDGIDGIVGDALDRGEAALLISFAPPHRTPLKARCPIVPVVAWEFPTIPDRVWAGDARNDWRFVLRQTGRAIALCDTAAAAMRAAMGCTYPAISLPTPVWDRYPELQRLDIPTDTAISIDGFVFDTRGRRFAAGDAIPPVPDNDGNHPDGRLAPETVIGGVVFAAVLAPKDGRKNWPDILTAFVAAFRDNAEATLVIKMIGSDPGLWWWEAHELLGKERPFECRVVVLHGYLDETGYNALVAATHWVVSASKAEGQCLPLLEFMCGGRPAIAPCNTAMCDYVHAENALIVDSKEEYCGWPHDPLNEMTTTRYRVNWSSLRDRLTEAYRLSREDPIAYGKLSDSARLTMRDYCGDTTVAARLDEFLGLGLGLGTTSKTPSKLLEETRRL